MSLAACALQPIGDRPCRPRGQSDTAHDIKGDRRRVERIALAGQRVDLAGCRGLAAAELGARRESRARTGCPRPEPRHRRSARLAPWSQVACHACQAWRRGATGNSADAVGAVGGSACYTLSACRRRNASLLVSQGLGVGLARRARGSGGRQLGEDALDDLGFG